MGIIVRKNLAEPDEVRELDHWTATLTRVGTHSVGTGVLQPGWVWSKHMGPVMGTDLCPVRHVQLVQSGRIAFRMADGEEVELQPGDVADIPPGHEAWVVGNEPCVVLDIAGNIDVLGLPQEHERVVTTLLLSDIVNSTKTAERLGDQAWKQLLAEHDRIVRVQIERYRGTRGEHDRRRLSCDLRERGKRDALCTRHPRQCQGDRTRSADRGPLG